MKQRIKLIDLVRYTDEGMAIELIDDNTYECLADGNNTVVHQIPSIYRDYYVVQILNESNDRGFPMLRVYITDTKAAE